MGLSHYISSVSWALGVRKRSDLSMIRSSTTLSGEVFWFHDCARHQHHLWSVQAVKMNGMRVTRVEKNENSYYSEGHCMVQKVDKEERRSVDLSLWRVCMLTKHWPKIEKRHSKSAHSVGTKFVQRILIFEKSETFNIVFAKWLDGDEKCCFALDDDYACKSDEDH